MQSIIVSKHYSNIKSPIPGIPRYIYVVSYLWAKVRHAANYFHTPTYALVSYIIKSALIIYIKTLYSLIAPTCFDTCVIIRERLFSELKSQVKIVKY
jgi:hypothetical protein